MKFSNEFKIGTFLSLIFALGGGAAIVWPSHWIGYATMTFSAICMVALILVHFFAKGDTQLQSKVEVIRTKSWESSASPPRLRLELGNTGKITIESFQHFGILRAFFSEISVEDENSLMDGILTKIQNSTDISKNEFQPNRSLIVDFNLEQNATEVLAAVEAGQIRLYLFLAISYRDKTTPKNKVIITEYCVYYHKDLLIPFYSKQRNRTYLKKI